MYWLLKFECGGILGDWRMGCICLLECLGGSSKTTLGMLYWVACVYENWFVAGAAALLAFESYISYYLRIILKIDFLSEILLEEGLYH